MNRSVLERAREGKEETEKENKTCVCEGGICVEVPGCQPFSIIVLSLDQKVAGRCRCPAACVCLPRIHVRVPASAFAYLAS